MITEKDIVHYDTCNAKYPEKAKGEKPRQVQRIDIDKKYFALVCTDCGAQVTNLPDEDDPYWDEAKAAF